MADKLVKQVSVRLGVDGVEKSKVAIDQIRVKAEELKAVRPDIVVTVDKARALLEARLTRLGVKAELEKAIDLKVDVRQGLLSKLAGIGGGSGGGGALSAIPGFGGGIGETVAASGPIGWAAITAGVAAASVEIAGLVSGFAAATAGVGAFGLLAIPTFDKIKNAYTGISAAQQTYNAAVALNKEDPTKTHATAAAAALVKLKVAQEAMGPSTRQAVTGIQSLVAGFEKMATAFQPTVMKVFNDALKAANNLLPALAPMATAAGGAIGKLLAQFDKFTRSQGFKQWLGQFDKLIGPSIGAIGTGIGKIINDVGKLITRFSAHDVAHAINLFVDPVVFGLTAIRNTIGWAMTGWDKASAAITAATKLMAVDVLSFFVDIVSAAAKAFGWIPGIGGKLRTAASAFSGWAARTEADLSGVAAAAGAAANALAAVANAQTSATRAGGHGPGHPLVAPHAAGGWASGWSLVGEQGPELMYTPGSQVYSNAQSRQMVGGNTYVTVNVAVGHGTHPRQAAKEIADILNSGAQAGIKLRKSILAGSG